MNFKEDILLGFEALKLNREATKKIINKTDNGWSVTLIISLAAGISSVIGIIANILMGNPLAIAGLFFIIPTMIMAPIAFIIGSSIYHLGAKILGGKGTGISMYKGLGSVYIFSALSSIQYLNILVSIWIFVTFVVSISEIHQFSKLRAFFSMFIVSAIIVGLIFLILGPLLLTTMLEAFNTFKGA